MAALVDRVTRAMMRIGLRLLGSVAPDRAGRLAFHLFSMTPPRVPKSARARALLAGAASRLAAAERRTLAIAGGMIAAYRFAAAQPPMAACGGNEKPPILVVHGWGSRSAFMLPLIDRLRASGRPVVAIDLPGHGGSSGGRLHMGMAVAAIDSAWRQYGPFAAIIGHSFGGAAALASVVGVMPCIPARRPDKLVLIAAPSVISEIFDRFSAALRLSEAVDAKMRREILRLTGRPLSSFVGARMLADCRVDALVVHARDDKEVGFHHAEAYAAAGRHVRLTRADGLGHRRILSAPAVHAAIIDFLDDDGGAEGVSPQWGHAVRDDGEGDKDTWLETTFESPYGRGSGPARVRFKRHRLRQ